MASNMPALPGFGDLIQRDVDRAGALDLTDAKRYTADVLYRDYPGTYQAVARALFYYRLPVRAIKDLFRISSETVQAVRNRVLAASAGDSRAAFFAQTRRSSQRDIVLAQLMDVIEERLSDPSKLDDLSTHELVDLMSRIEGAPKATNRTEDVHRSDDVTVVDADVFDEAINGLVAQKNGAGDRSGVEGLDDLGDGRSDCSAGSTSATSRSVELSIDGCDLLGISAARGNSCGKSSSDGGDLGSGRSVGSAPAGSSDPADGFQEDPQMPPPGGAAPGAARGPGLD